MPASFFFSSTLSPTTRTLPRPASQLQPPTFPANKHLPMFRCAGRVRSECAQFATIQHMAPSSQAAFRPVFILAPSLSLCFWSSSIGGRAATILLALG
ncbi:hypothetical protein XELAEV_18037183mg [Xenopus laevis]|uniref:Uncharacterized protein n=1 Tax=Xenopus laevis TaxID=8355 RepID=A0A974HAF0_XENLA|nr:hypothetical protein XELAEV_18037183mg [Xenopus laevis]